MYLLFPADKLQNEQMPRQVFSAVRTKRVSRPPVMLGQATRKRENRENAKTAKTAETKRLDLTQLTVF